MTKIAHKKQKVRNVPNLRFPGFTERWETKKLGDVISNKSKKYNPAKEFKIVKCIELEHIQSSTGELLGFVDGSQSGSIKNIFKKGDVLFGKLRPYLKKYHKPEFDGVCSSEIWVLNGSGISNEFLYYLIQTNKFIELANQSSGSKMPRADWNIVENGTFSFPTFDEQKKIGEFFSLLESRIQTQSKIIEGLKLSKQAMIKNIFSQQIKFKNSNGKTYPVWELKKLGDIGETYNGLIGKTKENFGTGKPYIQYKQIFDQSKIDVSKYDLVRILSNEKQNRVKKGDVFFTISSETPEEIGMSSVLLDDVEEMYLNSFCFGYRPNSIYVLNPSFARYLFRSSVFRNEIIKLAQGSTRYNMSKIGFMKLQVYFPCIEEQIKIANFLSSIDSKIDLEIKLLKKINEQKKFLLQNLFV